MAFKRATWHSGLTYKKTCENCSTTVTYNDYNLDFRPWFPDGFVYCPTCKKPLRHNENNAVSGTRQSIEVDLTATTPKGTPPRPAGAACFCHSCGKRFTSDADVFCAYCGTKRV